MNILTLPNVILNHTISFLRLDDVSMIVNLCKHTVRIQQNIYKAVRIALICFESNINKVVDNCPGIKHLTLDYEITLNHKIVQVLGKLNLESFDFNDVDKDSDDNTQDIVLPFKNLKTISMYKLTRCDLKECKLLENIKVCNVHIKIDKDDFPNLKSVVFGVFVDDHDSKLIQYDIPITELTTVLDLNSDMLRLPLRKLSIYTSHHRNKSCLEILQHMQLEELHVYGNIPKNISFNEMKLKSLSLTDCNVQIDLSILRNLTNLTSLELRNCKYKKSTFKYLESLKLVHLLILNSEIDIDVISKFKLKYLYINDRNIISSDIMKLPLTLTELTLCSLKHDLIDDIPYFDKLHTLFIRYDRNIKYKTRRITDNGLKAICRLPVVDLTLSNCGLCDNDMDFIANMNVNILNLDNNDISIIGAKKLRKLPLRKLDINAISASHIM